jgi:hypothetical protein
MAWNTQEIELHLEKALKKKFKQASNNASKYLGYYTYARDMLISEKIYDDIKVIQKGLSDHGENHVMDVLENTHKLLGNDLNRIEPLQLYFICLLVLFHDVGNLTADRTKHHEQDVIREIYDYIRNKKKEFDEERVLIPEVASKHSGTASDGSIDPIKELSTQPPFLFRTEIHTKNCAGLLRFADELAEGPHRTSTFMNKYYNYPYPEKSIIYHKYAEIAKINIDRRNERICLTYNFSINAINGIISEKEHDDFIELFYFTIRRMLKLEAERKYCKYYCRWLEPFKKTHVTFNFIIENSIGGSVRAIRIHPQISELYLDDLTLPINVNPNEFFKERLSFEPETLFQSIKVAFNEK